jgi:alanyl-tRNA synthetase
VGAKKSSLDGLSRYVTDRAVVFVADGGLLGGYSGDEVLTETSRFTGSVKCRERAATFKLYDTFGFPIDLTELMAIERGYRVDIAGFDAALQGQRKQFQEDRKSRKLSVVAGVETVAGVQFLSRTVKAETIKDLQALGEVVRERIGSGLGVLVADFGDDKGGLVVVVTNDLRTKGITADCVVKALAAKTGIRGGGKDHMAQAGLSGEQVGTMLGLAGKSS